MQTKIKLIGQVWLVQQCCSACGKVAQQREEVTYGLEVPKPKFDNNNIPVGWYSTFNGVYCSKECFNLRDKHNKIVGTGEL